MLQKQVVFLRRGEKPTHAGRSPRVEIFVCSAAGDRPLGQNQGWSARSSLEVVPRRWFLRLPRGGVQSKRTRPMYAGSVAPLASPSECGPVCPTVVERAYRNRGARRQWTMTTGTLTFVQPGCSGEVTSWYKLCESWLGCDGDAVDFTAFFGGLSISRLRSGPWSRSNGARMRMQAKNRGE
jgi:hypothetical protein